MSLDRFLGSTQLEILDSITVLITFLTMRKITMSNFTKRATTAMLLLGICFFALSSAAIMASTNSGGGSFDDWILTPGGQLISEGAINGQPGMSKAFKRVYEAMCGVDISQGCFALCTQEPEGACHEWVEVYTDNACLCSI